MIRQQKIEQNLDFQNNKLDELLDRQFTNDKVIHRLEVKMDKLIGRSGTTGMGGIASAYGMGDSSLLPKTEKNKEKGSQNKHARRTS